jgi:YD repeat-containing protein
LASNNRQGDITTVTVQFLPGQYNYYEVQETYDSNNHFETFGPYCPTGGCYANSYAYTLSNGSITECDVTIQLASGEYNSTRKLLFDSNHYLTSDTRGIKSGSTPETTSYTRGTATELVTQITDSINRKFDFQYDINGSPITLANLTKITEEATSTTPAASTAIAWDVSPSPGPPVFDEIQSITDPLQHTWSFGIDAATGNVTSESDPLGRTTTFPSYNASGQVMSVTDPAGNTTNFGYNGSGDLASVTDQLGYITSYAYDSLGRATSVTSPLREKTQFSYDAMDHVSQVVDPNNNSTSYTYDLVDDPTKLTDAHNNVTTWTWTAPSGSTGSPWNWAESDPVNGTSGDMNDVSGQPIHVFFNGHQRVFSYDTLGRVTQIKYAVSDGSFPVYANYGYDLADR